MNEIGNLFKEARINSSLELEEVSSDTDIPVYALEQIEEGSIGSFKDIFVLKEYLKNYAKYLGLNGDEIIDKFNEYMFEYTSKLPTEEIERVIEEQEKLKEDTPPQGVQAISPYLNPQVKEKWWSKTMIISIIIIILVALVIIWAVRQVI